LRSFLDGRLLSEPSTSLLLRIMTESPTGRTRLRAGLPAGATIAHKTGTGRRVVGIASSINDIGIATLRDGRRVAIAVFVNGTAASDSDIDALHARVAAIATR
jgi:beta-lactamase class A